jgi:hypothetical protein
MTHWQKRYGGKLYTVGPRQLGIELRTKAASRRTANQRWAKKKAEIDGAAAPAIPDPVAAERESMPAIAIPPEILGITRLARSTWTKDQCEIREGRKQKAPDQTNRLIRSFKALCNDELIDRFISHRVERFPARKLAEVAPGEITQECYESYRCETEAFRSWIGADSAIQAITPAFLENFLTHSQKQIARGAIAAKTAASRLSRPKQFIRTLWELERIALSRNIDSRQMKVQVPRPEQKTISLAGLIPWLGQQVGAEMRCSYRQPPKKGCTCRFVWRTV